jgi:hypothetical protein
MEETSTTAHLGTRAVRGRSHDHLVARVEPASELNRSEPRLRKNKPHLRFPITSTRRPSSRVAQPSERLRPAAQNFLPTGQRKGEAARTTGGRRETPRPREGRTRAGVTRRRTVWRAARQGGAEGRCWAAAEAVAGSAAGGRRRRSWRRCCWRAPRCCSSWRLARSHCREPRTASAAARGSRARASADPPSSRTFFFPSHFSSLRISSSAHLLASADEWMVCLRVAGGWRRGGRKGSRGRRCCRGSPARSCTTTSS